MQACHQQLNHLQSDLVVSHHPAEIEDSIAHATEACVDTYIGHFSNFFELKLLIEPHIYDFTLCCRQEIHQFSDIFQHLCIDIFAFYIKRNEVF